MNIFNTSYNQNLYDIGILLLRITVGCFMMTHGLHKLDMLMEGGVIKFADPIGIGAKPSLILTVFAELVCSFLIVMGFAIRLAALPLIVTMLVIIFVVHAKDGFTHKELPALYLAIYVLLLIVGSGRFSVDRLIAGKKRKSNY
ncbi:DoxX family protein [Flavobacterium litorale]|uniref:DoxX family protein n=2 Tax=Flavobacterium litorale TaxID=2856519 RepID=A0ABX8VE62_9FLAO|nr:DoxX family protein [Flavobacterium litorale]